MSGDEVFQFRVAPVRGASCTEGKWTDITSSDGSFSFAPHPLTTGPVHVQVRVKPPFTPGYYQPKTRCGMYYVVEWFTYEPDLSKYERVEVTPVGDR